MDTHQAFGGSYFWDGTTLTVESTWGASMSCPYTQNWTVTFEAGCATAILNEHIDNCTGARLYLDGDMTLTHE